MDGQTKAVPESGSGVQTLFRSSKFLNDMNMNLLTYLLQDTAIYTYSWNTLLEELTFSMRTLYNSKHYSNTKAESSLLRSTHSNTELSFWSPQIRISVMERMVSTSRLRLWSVTVVFLVKIWYMYLKEKVSTSNVLSCHFHVQHVCLSSLEKCRPTYMPTLRLIIVHF